MWTPQTHLGTLPFVDNSLFIALVGAVGAVLGAALVALGAIASARMSARATSAQVEAARRESEDSRTHQLRLDEAHRRESLQDVWRDERLAAHRDLLLIVGQTRQAMLAQSGTVHESLTAMVRAMASVFWDDDLYGAFDLESVVSGLESRLPSNPEPAVAELEQALARVDLIAGDEARQFAHAAARVSDDYVRVSAATVAMQFHEAAATRMGRAPGDEHKLEPLTGGEPIADLCARLADESGARIEAYRQAARRDIGALW